MLENFRETVDSLSESVKSTVAEKELEADTLDPLLEQTRLKLLKNNVSISAAESIEEEVRDELLGEKVTRGSAGERVREAVSDALLEMLDDSFSLEDELEAAENPPSVFLVGFNGSGKTTTAAKLASLLQDEGREVVLGAADTFRAASIEQLEDHGEKLDVKVVSHDYGSDPAAVAYDTIEHAEKEDAVAIVDTAGRSHSDENLMDELEKLVEVNEPDVSLLVVDALTGNDAAEQVDAFDGMFDAIVVTKMDVDEDGGALLTVSQRSGTPVAFMGTGQGYTDLENFDSESFVENILD